MKVLSAALWRKEIFSTLVQLVARSIVFLTRVQLLTPPHKNVIVPRILEELLHTLMFFEIPFSKNPAR